MLLDVSGAYRGCCRALYGLRSAEPREGAAYRVTHACLRAKKNASMSLNSVVRVFATVQEPDYDSPWQPRAPSSSTGSGVVIGPKHILTGAHVVANATFLQVQKVFDPDKCTARVVAA